MVKNSLDTENIIFVMKLIKNILITDGLEDIPESRSIAEKIDELSENNEITMDQLENEIDTIKTEIAELFSRDDEIIAKKKEALKNVFKNKGIYS